VAYLIEIIERNETNIPFFSRATIKTVGFTTVFIVDNKYWYRLAEDLHSVSAERRYIRCRPAQP